jgi:putative ABC transport system permease protein
MSAGRPSPLLVWQLAWKDLVHERLLSICLIIALAGVLAPSLVLFGLKSGVITAMRAELVEDPVFREIRPKVTQNYDAGFFERVRAQPETQFMVESVLRGASLIRVDADAGGENLDMLPTGPGDPLLEENDTAAPAPGEVVLTATAAEALEVEPGDTVTLRAQRTESGATRNATQEMRVSGILPLRADKVKRVYVPVQFALDVESFREGFAVAQRDWQGQENTATAVYDGVIIGLESQLSAVERSQLTVNTGFFLVESLSAAQYQSRFGYDPPDRPVLLDVKVIDRAAPADAVTRVRRRLAGRDAILRPYVRPVELTGPDGAAVEAHPSGYGMLDEGEVSLPSALMEGRSVGDTVNFSINGPQMETPFTLIIGPSNDAGRVFLPVETLGVLRRAAERDLAFDSATGRFSLERPGYRGFRLYARSIDDVEALDDVLQAEGIETITEITSILRIQELDRGLSRLFWLIASLSFAAGALVLLASQYGAVERKQGALAHLRLIGLSRGDVGRFPLSQGLMLAGISGLAGLAFAYLAQFIINNQFAVPLGFDRRMCTISPMVAVLAVGTMVGVSALVSALAARRATQIDPAEGIRHE